MLEIVLLLVALTQASYYGHSCLVHGRSQKFAVNAILGTINCMTDHGSKFHVDVGGFSLLTDRRIDKRHYNRLEPSLHSRISILCLHFMYYREVSHTPRHPHHRGWCRGPIPTKYYHISLHPGQVDAFKNKENDSQIFTLLEDSVAQHFK